MYQAQEFVSITNKTPKLKSRFWLWAVKLLIVMLCCVFSWNASGQALSVVELYLEKPDYVMNVIKRSDNLDYENNYVLKGEIEKTIDSILSYTLDYQLTDDSKFSFDVIHNINSEFERAKKQIDLVKEIIPYQIENNLIDADFIEKGFVTLILDSNGSIDINGNKFAVHINSEIIDQYYIDQRDVFIEDFKQKDPVYCSISTFLNSLNGVYYAVKNYSDGVFVSNVTDYDSSNISSFFSDKKNTIIIHKGTVSGTMNSFGEYVSKQAEDYSYDFDMYISFENII